MKFIKMGIGQVVPPKHTATDSQLQVQIESKTEQRTAFLA